MNYFDKEYLSLLQDILDNGVRKNTRSGEVISVFGRNIRMDLKKGLPILTTKKVFYRGCIVELLWFLRGDTNIKYLVDRNVHIWDDDAYRRYLELSKNSSVIHSKEEFINAVKEQCSYALKQDDGTLLYYLAGDVGPIYGYQWRNFDGKGIDQIQNIINTLKTNPNDRRMVCVAFNPADLEKMALPPCHVMFQFYTKPIDEKEREKMYFEKFPDDTLISPVKMNDIPKHMLSCKWTQRSCDMCLGIPYNCLSYSLLTIMIAKVCNMIPDEVIGDLGDCHIYLNQMDGVKTQLKREGFELPTLKIKRDITSIDDFTYDDFEIVNYHSDGAIKFPLSVGL